MGNKRRRDYEEVEEFDEDDYEIDEELVYARRKRNQIIIVSIIIVIVIILAGFYLMVVNPSGVLGIYPGDPELNANQDGIKIHADVALEGTGTAEGDGKLEVFLDGEKTYSGTIPIKSGVAKKEILYEDFVTENGDYDIKISFEGKSAYLDSPYEVNWVVEEPVVKLRRMMITETENLTKNDKPYFFLDIELKDQNNKPIFKVNPINVNVELKYENQQTAFLTDTFEVTDELQTIVTKKYNYNTAGNITADVLITNKFVNLNSDYKKVTGKNDVPTLINAPPVAKAEETDGKVSLLINNGLAEFDASDSFDLDGSIVQYQWDFGDESDDNLMTTTEPTATHNYEEQKTYTVSLTVLDNFEGFDPQGFDSYTFTITVTRL